LLLDTAVTVLTCQALWTLLKVNAVFLCPSLLSTANIVDDTSYNSVTLIHCWEASALASSLLPDTPTAEHHKHQTRTSSTLQHRKANAKLTGINKSTTYTTDNATTLQRMLQCLHHATNHHITPTANPSNAQPLPRL
jgi:hypothetical protein